MPTREEFWAGINKRKQQGWMNYNDWTNQFGRNLPPYARWREYQNFLATAGTVRPIELKPSVRPIEPKPFIPPPRPPQNPPATEAAMGAPGNTGSPISITYKFSDPNRPPAGQTQQAKAPQKAAPLINPLPSQAPAGVGGGAGYDRNWRAGIQSGTRPQGQGGLTNWLTRPASPPQAGGFLGRLPRPRIAGGGYNAF